MRQLSDSTGALTLGQSYEPFGDLLDSTGTGSSSYGFTGEWTDGTGLLNLRARYMNTGVGRFTTRDTWEGDYNRPLSLNRWNYVEGNPVNYTDPSGQCIPVTDEPGGPCIPAHMIDEYFLANLDVPGIDCVVGGGGSVGAGSAPNLPFGNENVDFFDDTSRRNQTKRVLQMLENYKGDVWWKTQNGKLDAHKIKAWILMYEGDTLWWIDQVVKGKPHPITLMAKIINYRIGFPQYFQSTSDSDVGKLSVYTVIFNPDRASNAFTTADWNLWLKPPIQGALDNIDKFRGVPDGLSTNWWLETELRAVCRDKNPKDYKFKYLRPKYGDEIFFGTQAQFQRCVQPLGK